MSAKVYQIDDAGYSYPSLFWDPKMWIENYDEIPPDIRKRVERKAYMSERSGPAADWKNKAYISRGEFTHTTVGRKLLYLLQNPLDLNEWFFIEAAACRGGSKQDYIHKMFIGQVT